jgi:hypothetical protein
MTQSVQTVKTFRSIADIRKSDNKDEGSSESEKELLAKQNQATAEWMANVKPDQVFDLIDYFVEFEKKDNIVPIIAVKIYSHPYWPETFDMQ